MSYPRNMDRAVDELGSVREQIAELQARERELKQSIYRFAADSGCNKVLGDDYIATVYTQDRAVTNWQGVVTMLADQFAIRSELVSEAMGACTTITRNVPGIRMSEMTDKQRANFALR